MQIKRKSAPAESSVPAILDTQVAERILQERLRRDTIAAKRLWRKVGVELPPERKEFLLGRCHAKQRAFIEDPAKQKAALVGGRGGKSTACMIYTIYVAEQYPNSVIPYVVPESKNHAQDMFWRPMKQLNESLQLGLRFKEVEKVIEHPNGAIIRLLGAHDEGSEARLVGVPFPFIVLDECADFGDHLERMVLEAVLPRLDDYDGTIAMIGTPGRRLEGFFYDITIGRRPGWAVHKWNRVDNIFLEPHARDVYAIAAKRGIDTTSPAFRRQSLGEWCADNEELAYPFSETLNGWDGALDPRREWRYVMAVDFGETDDSAWVVCAFADGDPHLYFIETYNMARMSLDAICEKTLEFWRKYPNMVSITGDSGGFGRPIVSHLNARYGVPMQPVDKRPGYKAGAIAEMRNDFVNGRIHAVPGSPLVSAWARVNKDPRTGLTQHTDLGDAALYAFMGAQHWVTSLNAVTAEPLEAWQTQEIHDINKAVKQRHRDWWDNNHDD